MSTGVTVIPQTDVHPGFPSRRKGLGHRGAMVIVFSVLCSYVPLPVSKGWHEVSWA
jgi:hypothetical protein